MAPKTRYARSGELHIAYQVVGDGPIDLVYVPTWLSQVEHLWELPRVARFFERLTSFSRLILFDRRGSGLSDPTISAATLEDQMDDVLAVMDAAGSERAALFAQFEGGPMATLFAATHPERTTALVLYATFARATRAPDYPHGLSPEARQERIIDPLLEDWGVGERGVTFAPSLADDAEFRDWWGKLERLSGAPGHMGKILGLVAETDIRDVLPQVRVPTLVVGRPAAEVIDNGHSHFLAENIPGARLVELPGADALPTAGDTSELASEIEEFLTGERSERTPDRVLATVMFTDIVGSTRRAAELGDARWRSLLERHDELVRRHLARHNGRAVKSTGDGFLATFDGPARGVRCAAGIVDAVRDLDLELRAGLHTGECEVMGDDVGGLAVHIGARVSSLAGANEVLVSSTVKDLVVGSGIEFAERGAHELKGVPGEWRIYSVAGAP